MNRFRVLPSVLVVALGLSLVPTLANAAGTTTALADWKVKVLPIPTLGAAYDASRDVVLASVASSHPSLGNHLVELNPRTGAVGRSIFVGSSPKAIAITDDHSKAYVGLSGANRIVKVDLASFTVEQSFITILDDDGPFFVQDLEVAPGRNDVVVASLQDPGHSPAFRELHAWKDGLRLPNTIPFWQVRASRIDFMSPNKVIGYDSETSSHETAEFLLDEQGFSLVANSKKARSFWGDDFELSKGRLYSNTGFVVDEATNAEVFRFSLPIVSTPLHEVTEESNRVTYLADKTILVYDTVLGTSLGSRSFPSLPQYEYGDSLVSTGDGFVYSAREGLSLLGPNVGGGAIAVPAAPTSTLAGFEVKEVPLGVTRLVYDETRHRIYASVDQYSETSPNRLVALDPATGKVLDSVFLGSDPNQLALSDDHSRIFVGLDGAGQVKEVNLETFTVAKTFTVKASPFQIAGEMKVMPGTTNTLALIPVDPSSLNGQQGISIYRDGIALPKVAYRGWDQMVFDGPSKIYALDSTNTEFLMSTLAVSDQGVEKVSEQAGTVPQFYADIKLSNGILYSSPGLLIDPATYNQLGAFDATSNGRVWGGGIAVEVVPELNRAFMRMGSGVIEEYELDRLRRVGTLQGPYFTNRSVDFVYTGTGFASTGGFSETLVLYIPKGGGDPSPSPTPSPSPSPSPSPTTPAPDPSTPAGSLSWGWNGLGHLGTGGKIDRHSPGSVSGLGNAVQLTTGLHHSVALKDDGTVWAWGWNGLSQLGNGTLNDSLAPQQVPGLTNVVSIATGFLHNLAVKSDGTVWAWGWNYYGQLGVDSAHQPFAPVRVPGLSNMKSVSAGAYHSVALKADGTVWAWGYGALGQLGDGMISDRSEPRRVSNLSSVTSVAAGSFHNLAVDGTGRLWAWGWNALYQLGDGSQTDRWSPVEVNVPGNVADVAAGCAHSLAIDDQGNLYSWGWNVLGQLGLGDAVDRNTPQPAGSGYEEISAGLLHSLAAKEHELFAFGWNALGQLGDGTTSDRLSPKWIATGNFTVLSAGTFHSLANRS